MSDGDEGKSLPQEAAGEEMTLAAREARWGFTLDELHAATKVVRTLFHDPSLFVGDPYLHESRLYTMITRDRKTKRENRDVYKAIMNEEKSYRKRYKRMQDIEAIRRTEMKREREEALCLLQQQENEGSDRVVSLIRDRVSGPADTVDGQGARRSEDCHDGLSTRDRQIISQIGAFENIIRLEAMYTAGSAAMDWAAASHLVAQVYRYLPHSFGTQMPPVLIGGSAPPGTDLLQQEMYTATIKLRIARLCGELFTLGGNDDNDDENMNGISGGSNNRDCGGKKAGELVSGIPSDEDIVVADSGAMRDLTCLRNCGTLDRASVDVVKALKHNLPVTDALHVFERAVSRGEPIDLFVTNDSVGTLTSPDAKAGGNGSGVQWSVDASLNLFIARRLYSKRRYRELGESPSDFPTRPPVSDDEEPDSFSVFQDIQQYVAGRPIPCDEALQLSRTIACHTCRVRYDKLHPYYYSMCHLCGEYNFNKRLMTRDLRGKVVLLTGCRIKIGFAMALSLLRCGAELIGTTRFAHEAVARFQREADYCVWAHRLHLFSLDLRDMWLVTQFCAFVMQKFGKLFAIINNAAQTIARTREYTKHLRHVESHPPLDLHKTLYEDAASREWHQYFLSHSSVTIGEPLHIEHHPQQQPFLDERITTGDATAYYNTNATGHSGVLVAIARSPLVVGSSKSSVFDRYDTAAEESDHRVTNSWVMKLAEVQGSEAAEVMAINALSPFIINSKLKPALLNRTGDPVADEPRFIINVSAMEGQFYRFKQVTHPHTNMAKAALNMMTRTSGEDYAQDGIYMNSVDTGWITDESPKAKKERRADQHQLCPLDEVDAAARCLDLIYSDRKVYGKFFKDFREIPW
ncbi:oxidoreductase-like protein [Trypanosoma brucei gambiense DAL972]|uniref:Oxidoreductase-like protein n=1 Tax=Trypanosoma brucei gambiense (strain MHOM/CI/86/DAL972) TaxID=679716 RepID=D0A7W5_TRYB9|nr:oxidoreductase-like protein [Trypanosoma brucei gambiense DAL972]CBH17766.1 oxidoreductase-like protein [Trypanosoma brucei gambiense DAL972]|eukprot:XP_011780030.1 oxidoreductase-like protein [Trypanosoma brucei gambiense DAL972]